MNNISSRYKKMDDFLKEWRDIATENTGLCFTYENFQNAIYKRLTRYGVNDEEQKYNLDQDGVFDRWVERYKNHTNINAFVSPGWKYFCQFTNRENLFRNGRNEEMKVYVPLDREHIEKGANLIFDYLEKNNIAHISKIGKNIRIDDIVIRLGNEKELKMLLKFIENEKYIQEGLIKPNPFAYNYNQIALACDRNLSYNYTIASLIAIYIETRKKEGQLEKIKLTDFINFTLQYRKERFEKYEQSEETLKDFGIDIEDLSEQEISSKLLNLNEITTLFLNSTNLLFSFNNYLEHYNKNKDAKIFKEKVLELTALRKEEKESLNVDDIINEIITTVKEKYDEEYGIKVIESYLQTGKETYLTKANNLRNKVTSTNFREVLNKYINDKNISFRQYYEVLREEKRETYLANAVLETYDKYQEKYEKGLEDITGIQWAVGALVLLIQKGKYNGFTNSNDARKNIVENVTVQDAIKIMRKQINYPNIGNDSINSEEIAMLSEDYVSRILEDRKQQEKRRHA